MQQATRACVTCSADISDRHWRTKYCDQACQYRHQRRLVVEARPARSCAWCQIDISTKKGNAVYCSRSCKSKAAERRLRKGTETGRARNRSRYQKERKRRQQYARQQYWSNRELYVERSRTWRRLNPDRRQIQSENRRAKKIGNLGYVPITARDWLNLRSRFAGCCAYCGTRTESLCMDHVVPLSRGGRHAPSNILPACPDCNGRKASMFLSEWRLRLSR